MASSVPQNLERAISKLKSLHDGGDIGVVETIACGQEAIPALRDLLFERESSGVFQQRCRAIEALAALKAHSVLMEFLNADRVASDPVERLGDDAVINAAALAVAKVRDEGVFQLLLRLAKRPSLTGVIGALGSFGRVEAIPLLINALEDDASRPTAKAALKRIGRTSRSALTASAKLRLPSSEHESDSSLRRRRSALQLLNEVGVPRKLWPELRSLMQDADTTISMIACKICLVSAPAGERRDAIHRLISLLSGADWMLRDEIEDCLVTHFAIAGEIIARYIQANAAMSTDLAVSRQIECALLRVRERAKQRSEDQM